MNPSGKAWTSHRYVLALGAASLTTPHYLLVWSSSLEDALEQALEWCDDYAPGLLTTFEPDDYRAQADALGVTWQDSWPDYEDPEFEKVAQATEADHMIIGHTTLKSGATHIASDEWQIVCEDPTRAQLKAFIADLEAR